MFLKQFPREVEIGDLVEMTMTMTQTTLLRVYEIVEIEKRSLTEEERTALDSLVALHHLADKDVRKLKKRMAN